MNEQEEKAMEEITKEKESRDKFMASEMSNIRGILEVYGAPQQIGSGENAVYLTTSQRLIYLLREMDKKAEHANCIKFPSSGVFLNGAKHESV